MEIRHFTFDPVLTDSFVRFSYDLYRGDTNWIPPIRKELYDQLSPELPFYKRPGNCHRHFLATEGRDIVGRISAMINRDLEDKDGTPVGTIGFFECVNDYAVAEKLLNSATRWLHDEQKISRIWGPMNFDIWHDYRLMTQGFDQKLFYGEPYNKSYYQNFFERYGFTAKQHWNSIELNGRDTLEKLMALGAARYHQFIERGYRFEQFNTRRFIDELRKLHSVLTQSFSGFLGFNPISFKVFEKLYAPSRYAFYPRLFTFVYDENNNLSGFAGAFLELSDAVRAMKGSNDPISKIKFFYYRHKVNRIMFHIIGKTPEEAEKRNGFGRALFCYILHEILAEGYESVLVTLLAKGNPSRRFLQEYAADDQRQYTLYEINR